MEDYTVKLLLGITVETIFIVIFIVRFFSQKTIEHGFNEKLEEHKHELSLISEATKFDYVRMNQDFGLWTVKRHESYAKLHNAIAEAISRVMGLRGSTSRPNYEQFNKEEIEQWLIDKNFIKADTDIVVRNWDSDRRYAMKELLKLDKLYREHKAEVACGEAQNALIDSQLYISIDIYNKLVELQRTIYFLLIDYRAEYSDATKIKEENELKECIPEDWKQVTAKMRSELSGGYVDE